MYIVQAADNYGVTANTCVDVIQWIMPLRILQENQERLLICRTVNTNPNHSVVEEKQLTTYEIW